MYRERAAYCSFFSLTDYHSRKMAQFFVKGKRAGGWVEWLDPKPGSMVDLQGKNAGEFDQISRLQEEYRFALKRDKPFGFLRSIRNRLKLHRLLRKKGQRQGNHSSIEGQVNHPYPVRQQIK